MLPAKALAALALAALAALAAGMQTLRRHSTIIYDP